MDHEHRNLLSVGYKNTIASRRAAWRTLSDIQEQVEYDKSAKNETKNVELCKWYKEKIVKELDKYCSQAIDLLKDLKKKHEGTNTEAEVFYLKMLADYYRYTCEYESTRK